MKMDDATWARHANPWSVYTRFTALPLLALSIWSRTWLDMWALIPIALTLFWIWINPRLFSAPKTTDNWASNGVMGEQLFLNRKQVPIPLHHLRAAHILTTLAGIGACIMIYGLWTFHVWATICGVTLSMGAKAWFFDRMVWLYEDKDGTASS